MQGSEFLLNPSYSGSAKEAVLQSCKQHFRPEFLNRLDDMVVFHPLKQTQLREVARMLTEELGQRLTARNVAMQVTDKALDFAVKQSYDPLYGARPIRRWLVRSLPSPQSFPQTKPSQVGKVSLQIGAAGG